MSELDADAREAQAEQDAKIAKQRSRDAAADAFFPEKRPLFPILAAAFDREITKLFEEWQNEVRALADLKRECSRDHTTPPDNHWQPEHRAKARYEIALAIKESFR